MKLFLSLSLILLVSCHSNTRKHASSNPGKDDLYSLIEKGAWTTYQHRDSIPDLLAEYLDRAGGGEFKMANMNEDYQSTDVIVNENLPWRQLRLLARSGNNWIMTYRHGGIGMHYHIITCRIDNNRITSLSAGDCLLDLDNIMQIKQALSSQDIRFKNLRNKDEADPF